MAFVQSWVETDPDGALITVSQLDDHQRIIKVAVRERLEGDPASTHTGIFKTGTFTAAPKIKELYKVKGTAAAPASTYDDNADLGEYWVSATEVGFSSGGTRVAGYNGSGLIADVIAELTAAVGVTIDGVLLKDGGVAGVTVTNLVDKTATETISGAWTFSHTNGIATDMIVERTGAAGVTIDGLLIKDSGIPQAAVTTHQAALTILESQITNAGLLARVADTETVSGLWTFSNAGGLKTDIIAERSAASGVTIDGLLIKDSGIPQAAVTTHEAAIDHDALTNFVSGEHFLQSAITTVGTVATGTWSATTIAVAKGGTNLTGYTTGDVIYASSATVLAKLPIGSPGEVLAVALGLPSWEPAGTPGAHVIATTAGLGASHTTSGLTAGQVLRATAATTAAFQALTAADIGTGTFGAGDFTFPGAVKIERASANDTLQVTSSTGANAAYGSFNNTGGPFHIGVDNSAGSSFTGTAFARFLWSNADTPIIFGVNNGVRLTISSATVTVANDLVVVDQVTVGGSILTGAMFAIEPGVVDRDMVTAIGMGLHLRGDTWGINAAGNSETKAIGALAYFGTPTWTSVGTSFVVTEAATVFIEGVPAGSTNVTLTNAYSLWVAAGPVKFDDALTVGGVVSVDNTTNSTSGTTGSIHTDGGLGVAKDCFFGATVNIESTSAADVLKITASTGTNAAYGSFNNTAGPFFVGVDDATGASFTGTNNARLLWSNADIPIIFGINNVVRLTLTSTVATFVEPISVDDITDSTSTITGSFHTDGGVGIAKDLILGATSTIFIGVTTNANMTIGLTMLQGTGVSNQILAFKSDDVAHGVTSERETDDFGFFDKIFLNGGLGIHGTTKDAGGNIGLELTGVGGGSDTTKNSASVAAVMVTGSENVSGTISAMGSTSANVFVVRTNQSSPDALFIVDKEGDLHATTADTGGAVGANTFDEYNDAALVRAFDIMRSPGTLIRTAWDAHVKYNEQTLIDAGILGGPLGTRPLINITQLRRLHNGCHWQAYVERQEMKQEHESLREENRTLRAICEQQERRLVHVERLLLAA